METIGKRLSEIIEKRQTNANKISVGTNIHASTIKNYIIDKGKPDYLKLDKIASFLKVNSEWLINGKGEIEKTKSDSNAIRVNFSEMNIMLVPLVSAYAYAGYLNGFGDEEYIEDLPKISWADDKEHRGEYLCFEVKGDSMDDGTTESIIDGDILLCRNVKQEFWKSKLHISKWDFVIVHKEKGVLVKRIIDHNVEKGILTLHSLNDYYEDFKIHLKDVAKILNVVDLKRKHKRR